mmetsp:Transcript_21823/g.34209  ORF Transcript_21823/g.34209 Transcript_21823/m.34209 type:complete len:125 (+) Transcript_21823:32-406(+)
MDARTGFFTLRRLVIQYCDWGGSSRGARDFLQTALPTLQQQFPHVNVEVVVKRNKHPTLIGNYHNGRYKTIGVKNVDADEIHDYAMYLIQQWGNKNVNHTGRRVKTNTQSISGVWTPYTNRPAQ